MDERPFRVPRAETSPRGLGLRQAAALVMYHRLMTLCINHTQGDSFSILCWHQCCGA